MSSISKNKSVSVLDIRNEPAWDLLDLREETNTYEHEFFESVAAEFNDIAGFKIEYYLMNADNIDPIYGEDTLKNFDGPYTTKIMYEPTNEQTLIDMFGFSSDDTVQYAEFPKVTFERDIMEQTDKRIDIDHDHEERKPIPGDVVKTLWDGKIWEISHVSSGEKIFHGKKMVWSIVLRPYQYAYESDDAEDMVFETIELDDFPEENFSTAPIELDDALKHNKIQEELANETDNYNGIDTSVYGYYPDNSEEEDEWS